MELVIAEKPSVAPVSYTHLDVYKRQPDDDRIIISRCNTGTELFTVGRLKIFLCSS